jgi:serine/threonine protein kinase
MALQTGTRLGPYEVLDPIGAGGTGEVYRARDSRLDRIVALKVLRADDGLDGDRQRRFLQEAKAASALNDPHIIGIYDIGAADGVAFIAMEFVPGQTLDRLIRPSGMRLSTTLNIAIEIATGLAKAHGAGITHRDLKPANIIVSDAGTVKILDFGVAKLRERISPDEEKVTQSSRPSTTEGTLLGTVGYMSPEQAEGKSVDERSDIFSFGSVLYEMLTGQRAFRGDSTLGTLAAILEKEPAPLAAHLPVDLRKLVFRCLRKDPEQRYQHISDLRIALEQIKEETSSPMVTKRLPRHWKSLAWVIVGSTVLSFVTVAAVLRLFRVNESTTSATFDVVPLTSEQGFEEDPSFSPDGNQVAYSWNGQDQDNYDIYVKLLGAPKPLRLTTDPADDRHPVFSPDGRSIGFVRVSNGRNAYVVTPAIGGTERTIAELPNTAADPISPFGSSWSSAWLPDGKSVVLDGLRLLSIETGALTNLVSDSGQPVTGWYPAVSPDGRTLAFGRPSGLAMSGIYLVDLSTKPRAEPRQLVLVNGDLYGLTWTADSRQLVYANGNLSGTSGTSKMLWRVAASAGAKPQRLPFGQGVTTPAISVHGARLAFMRHTLDANIWRATLSDAGGTAPRPARFVSSTQNDWNPQYSPDGTHLAFESTRTGQSAIWVSNADGSNAVEVFSRADRHAGTPRWAPDSERIAFDSTAEGNFDIYVIRPNSRQPVRLTTEPSDDVMPSWAPDGKWIYFASNRTGRQEVWRVPAAGGRAAQVTHNGGSCVYPSGDGLRIYYTKHDGDAALWSMPVAGGDETEVLPSVVSRNFAVFDDGIYFVPRASPDGRSAVYYLSFTTGAVELVVPIEARVSMGLTVSPDRRRILYVENEDAGSDLMLVDPFR